MSMLSAAGLVVCDKPMGVTSARCVSEIKRRLNLKKIGHCGTLDPMASGVLVLMTGNATRIARYINVGSKEYTGVIRFGLVTDTDDVEGQVLEERAASVDPEELQRFAKEFVGVIEQVPPKVSAVKVNGERSYRLARQGVEFELSSRPATVYAFEIEPLGADRARFRIECASGTYIRSIARDLGAKLGVGGCLEELRRTRVGVFGDEMAIPLAEISHSSILPWFSLFRLSRVPSVEISEREYREIRNGIKRSLHEALARGPQPDGGAEQVVLLNVSESQVPVGFATNQRGVGPKYGVLFEREYCAGRIEESN